MSKKFSELTPEKQAKRRAKIRKQLRRDIEKLQRKREKRGGGGS